MDYSNTGHYDKEEEGEEPLRNPELVWLFDGQVTPR